VLKSGDSSFCAKLSLEIKVGEKNKAHVEFVRAGEKVKKAKYGIERVSEKKKKKKNQN